MISKIEGIRIIGIGAAVSDRQEGVEDLFEFMNEAEAKKISETVGVSTRRVCKNICTSDLFEAAGGSLLQKISWDQHEVDGIVVVTQTPDYYLPSVASLLHGKLGLSKNAFAFDVNLGCSGYIYGLWIIGSLLKTSNAKKVLLFVGDTSTKLVSEGDVSTFPLFGDAGTVTAVEKIEADESLVFDLGSDGTGVGALMVPAGAFRHRSSEDTRVLSQDGDGNTRSMEHLYMNGAEVFNFSIREVPKSINSILEYLSIEIESIDGFVFHQANKFMLNYLEKKLKIPKEKSIYSINNYGNTSSASIPLTLVVNKSQFDNALLCGFGVGLSWGSLFLSLKNVEYCDVVFVKDVYDKI